MSGSTAELRIQRSLSIGNHTVGPGSPAFVIAEAGVNHDGLLDRAHALIDAALAVGADAIKFQTYHSDDLVSAGTPQAAYQMDRAPALDQREMLRRLELPWEAWGELKRHADDRGIVFLSTPFDARSLTLMIELGVPAIKISSGDLTNLPLISAAAASGRPLLCSSGMATLDEVGSAVDSVRSAGGDLAVLHCVSSYPAPADQLQLRVIPRIAEAFDCVVGFSDHSEGIVAPLGAVALGASILEKHFTLDKSLPGPDHAMSLDPETFSRLVDAIRRLESMLGDDTKRPQPSETELRVLARRSWAYARDLPIGAVVNVDDLVLKRPGTGLAPEREGEIVGRRLLRPVRADTLVALADLEAR